MGPTPRYPIVTFELLSLNVLYTVWKRDIIALLSVERSACHVLIDIQTGCVASVAKFLILSMTGGYTLPCFSVSETLASLDVYKRQVYLQRLKYIGEALSVKGKLGIQTLRYIQ